ncbi:MAG TPA: aminotransferase class I/II-fold pyridoxal phosphate-dependent enzyme, partial [Candidatus Atribacteria bacterium]|nr:aminotransferase class I/II-fold pyridoxal phosphate-dependent enzyme [Candidatus Atribacteria bacterium]
MNLFKENLKELSPYNVDHIPYRVKLNANENPYGIPDEIRDLIVSEIKNFDFSRYPDPMADELREVIADTYQLDKDMIMIGNGSDELINYLNLAFSGPGRIVSYPVPTFPMYRIYAIITEGKPMPIMLLNDLSLPSKKLLSTRATLIFISYPNSPTGNYFDEKDILDIIEGSDGVVIVDEAYYEFGKRSFIKYLDKYENLVILRTFPKAFSLAGMRVGYLIANSYIMHELKKVKSPYNIN